MRTRLASHRPAGRQRDEACPSDTTRWQNTGRPRLPTMQLCSLCTVLPVVTHRWLCTMQALLLRRSLTRCLPPTAPPSNTTHGRRLAGLGSRPSHTTAWQNVSEICDCACSALGPCSYPQVARCYAGSAACRVPPPPRWLGLFLAGSAHLPPQRRMRRSLLKGDPPFHAPAGGRTLADPTTCPSIPP